MIYSPSYGVRVNDAGGGSRFKKEAIVLVVIKAAAVLILPFLGYIALQTVSKPYYMVGRKFTRNSEIFSTVFVINPGPWKNRSPQIEFPLQGVEVVDNSGGVSVESKGIKMTVTCDSGLSPGCSFFVTFSTAKTNEIVPKVFCDGKVCKESPTVDLDVMMMFLLLMGAVIAVIAAFYAWQYFTTKSDLDSEKDGVIHKALAALLEKSDAQSDVNASIQSLVSFIGGEGVQALGRKSKKKSPNGQP